MELFNRLLYSLFGGVLLILAYVKVSLSYWKKRGILHEKPKLFWGNLKGFGKKRHINGTFKKLYEKYKRRAPFIGFYAFLKPMVLILDLELVHKILSLDAAFFMERGLYQNVKDDALSGNLMQLDGKEWEKMRIQIRPCFHDDKIQLIIPALYKVAKRFEKTLQKLHKFENVIDIKHLIERYNVDVISFSVFGIENSSLSCSSNEFLAMSRKLLEKISLKRSYLTWDFPRLARFFQYRLFENSSYEYFLNLVESQLKKTDIASQNKSEYNFLKLFMELDLHENIEERLNIQEKAVQCITFLLAGLKPCNITMSYCLYELALQPHIQRRAREEIKIVLEKHENEIHSEMLNDLRYLRQILYETLRKHSPYPALLRKVTEDYEVRDSTFILKKGDHLIIPISAIHHDSNIYANPEKFDPDRFHCDNMNKNFQTVFLPYGRGARGCIAQTFCEYQMLVGLLTLLKNYEFVPCTNMPEVPKYDNKYFISMPKNDTKLKLVKIE